MSHANETTNFGGRVSLLYKPTDKICGRLNMLQQQLDDGNDSTEDVVVVNGKIQPAYGDYNQHRTTLSPNGVRYYLYNGTINWDFDFATVTSATSYTVVKDGKMIFAKGYGYADLKSHTPVDPEKFAVSIASISKTFAWTAVMQMVEQASWISIATSTTISISRFR